MAKGREETMFPNFEVNFLYEEQRHNDEIRQIQLENEYRRAFRNSPATHKRFLGSLGLLAARLSAFFGGQDRPVADTSNGGGSARGKAAAGPDACTEPCLAS
jgi:hypothetical protein